MRWAGLPNLKMVGNYNKMTDEIVIWPSHTLWHEKETIAQVYKQKFLKLVLVSFLRFNLSCSCASWPFSPFSLGISILRLPAFSP